MIICGCAPHHCCSFLRFIFLDLLAAEIIDVEFLRALLVHPLVVHAEELLRRRVVPLAVNAVS